MSITIEHTIFCDKCGHWDRAAGSASAVRALAKKAGWMRIKQDGKFIDLCLECVRKR